MLRSGRGCRLSFIRRQGAGPAVLVGTVRRCAGHRESRRRRAENGRQLPARECRVVPRGSRTVAVRGFAVRRNLAGSARSRGRRLRTPHDRDARRRSGAACHEPFGNVSFAGARHGDERAAASPERGAGTTAGQSLEADRAGDPQRAQASAISSSGPAQGPGTSRRTSQIVRPDDQRDAFSS
ncbi:hypothetical protein D1872_267780 [compost metagenome]